MHAMILTYLLSSVTLITSITLQTYNELCVDDSFVFLLHARVGNSEKYKVFTFGWEYVGQKLSTEQWCNAVP